MEDTVTNPEQVLGWGVDADPRNEPTWPMRTRTGDEHAGYTWERPPQQQSDVEILHSNERPNLSATFGTSTPPAGLSGNIRRFAFRFSESSYGHWLPLMLADRVGVVEGIMSDLARGHVPNIPGELGIKAVWRHNRKGLVVGILVAAIFSAAVISRWRGGADASA